MLYLLRAMNSLLLSPPEAVRMTPMQAVRLNSWAVIAVAVACVSRMVLNSPGSVGWMRSVVALLPLVPGVLYARALWRWMSGLDEMQRRLQIEAVCFAALGMLFVSLALDLLRASGGIHHLNLGWEGYFAFTFFLWMFGLMLANRRYR